MAASVHEIAAISRIAARLAPLITTQNLLEIEQLYRLPIGLGLNKAKRLEVMLRTAIIERRQTTQAASLIASLTMEAHSRALNGRVAMTEADVDAIVASMREIRLDPGELARKGWRKGLTQAPQQSPSPSVSRPPSSSDVLRPVVHNEAIRYLQELTKLGVSPQHRGRELEKVVYEVLRIERLQPEHRIVNQGEEIDGAFVVAGHHYLLECKWEQKPCGLAHLDTLSSKVAAKGVGTFGVLLSMTGFVQDINEKSISRGRQPNCIGFGHKHFMAVIEGRSTWAELVMAARTQASRRAKFYTEP